MALDRTLLLPTTAEHHIDEASPLFGHTLQSLEVRRGRGVGGRCVTHPPAISVLLCVLLDDIVLEVLTT